MRTDTKNLPIGTLLYRVTDESIITCYKIVGKTTKSLPYHGEVMTYFCRKNIPYSKKKYTIYYYLIYNKFNPDSNRDFYLSLQKAKSVLNNNIKDELKICDRKEKFRRLRRDYLLECKEKYLN